MMEIEKILPVWKVEDGAMISMQGDMTIAYAVSLPEMGTQSEKEFEAAHQAFVKALRVLPNGSVFHKMDWFLRSKVAAGSDGGRGTGGPGDVLTAASDRFFNGREYLDHQCFIFLTQKPAGRKLSSSAYSNILRKSIAPVGLADQKHFDQFLSACGQFERILLDGGAASLRRLGDDELAGTANKPGIIERYLFLLGRNQQPVIRDVHVKEEIRVGDKRVELYTLADAVNLPSVCGSRINYEKYSTDKTKFSIGFASPLGQLLDCGHIYNQFIFIGDATKTIKQLEAKKLRLQSLSAYSRENAVARDA